MIKCHSFLILGLCFLFLSIVPISAFEIEETYPEYNNTIEYQNVYQINSDTKEPQLEHPPNIIKNDSIRTGPILHVARLEVFFYFGAALSGTIVLLKFIRALIPLWSNGNPITRQIIIQIIQGNLCWIIITVFNSIAFFVANEYDL